jgi:hypothetical protein
MCCLKSPLLTEFGSPRLLRARVLASLGLRTEGFLVGVPMSLGLSFPSSFKVLKQTSEKIPPFAVFLSGKSDWAKT